MFKEEKELLDNEVLIYALELFIDRFKMYAGVQQENAVDSMLSVPREASAGGVELHDIKHKAALETIDNLSVIKDKIAENCIRLRAELLQGAKKCNLKQPDLPDKLLFARDYRPSAWRNLEYYPYLEDDTEVPERDIEITANNNIDYVNEIQELLEQASTAIEKGKNEVNKRNYIKRGKGRYEDLLESCQEAVSVIERTKDSVDRYGSKFYLYRMGCIATLLGVALEFDKHIVGNKHEGYAIGVGVTRGVFGMYVPPINTDKILKDIDVAYREELIDRSMLTQELAFDDGMYLSPFYKESQLLLTFAMNCNSLEKFLTVGTRLAQDISQHKEALLDDATAYCALLQEISHELKENEDNPEYLNKDIIETNIDNVRLPHSVEDGKNHMVRCLDLKKRLQAIQEQTRLSCSEEIDCLGRPESRFSSIGTPVIAGTSAQSSPITIPPYSGTPAPGSRTLSKIVI